MAKIDVDYSERPNKSLLRGRILNIIDDTFRPQHAGSPRCCYVSFSGYRFLDSIAFYRRFNIRNVYSIENNERLHRRAEFNRPYVFFKITRGRIVDFIDEAPKDVFASNKVIWLDYECRFDDGIVSDIEALFASSLLDRDSLLFITFNRMFDRNKLTSKASEIVSSDIKSPEAFKTWISEHFSHFILSKLQRKYGTQKRLKEVLKAFYRDTANMAVLGYLVTVRQEGEDYLETTDGETFALPVLTFLEENYIRNNLAVEPEVIADVLGLKASEVAEYIKYC